MLLLNKVRTEEGKLLILGIGWASALLVRLFLWHSHAGDWTFEQ